MDHAFQLNNNKRAVKRLYKMLMLHFHCEFESQVELVLEQVSRKNNFMVPDFTRGKGKSLHCIIFSVIKPRRPIKLIIRLSLIKSCDNFIFN